MKKIFFGIVALVAMVATSCQQFDEVDVVSGETATVSFNLSTPEIANRAFSDGTTATRLQYAVYDANGNALDIYKKDNETINISKQVEFQLTTGNTYSVLFWAAAPSAPYTVNLDAKTMEVDYTSPVCSDENRDAFYYYGSFTVSNGMAPIQADLKRPFAQLNIGTSDYAASTAAGYTVSHAKVKVPVYTNLDFVSGDATNKQTVEFAYAAIPTSETFPVAGHEYMAMNYLLMNTTKETVDVVFTYATDATGAAAKERTVGSVPVQRNHRTNLYGQLLTASAKVNVEIKPEYDDDLPATLEEKLNIAAQLGGTVTLTENVTLNKPLVIGGTQSRASVPAILELDLNGNTISYTSDVAAHSAMITISSGNKLVVKDSQGNGKISYNYTGAGDSSFGWGTYTIYNNGGTLVVENGTIEMLCDLNANGSVEHMYCAVSQYSGSATINGGTISTPSYRSVRLWKSNMTINGGVFEGQVWVEAVDDTSVLTINGGSFAPRGVDSSSVFVTNSTYNPTLKVTGGTFETKIGCSDFTKEGVKGSVSGGTFGVAPNVNLLAEGMHAVESDGKYVVAENVVDDVVSVGNAQDLMAALNSLVAGNKVVLEKDIDLTGEAWSVSMPWQGSDTDVIFDGNGHKITGLSTTGLQGGLLGKYNSNGNITIKNLTLVDVTINGTNVDGESAGGALIGWIENHGAGAITIENVKVEGIKAEGFKFIGGLIGYNNGNVDMYVSGCSVIGKADSYLNSTYNESGNYKGHVGGLLGLWMRGSLTNCEVKDLTIKHGTDDMTGSSNRAGALVGTKYAGVEVVSATVENVTVDGVAATASSLFGPNASSATESDKSNVTIK